MISVDTPGFDWLIACDMTDEAWLIDRHENIDWFLNEQLDSVHQYMESMYALDAHGWGNAAYQRLSPLVLFTD